MEKEEKAEGKAATKTLTVNFDGFGKFVLKGHKMGDNLDLQDKHTKINSRTGEASIDTRMASLERLSNSIVDCPKGPRPDVKWLADLPVGIGSVLLVQIEELITVPYTVEKN